MLFEVVAAHAPALRAERPQDSTFLLTSRQRSKYEYDISYVIERTSESNFALSSMRFFTIRRTRAPSSSSCASPVAPGFWDRPTAAVAYFEN